MKNSRDLEKMLKLVEKPARYIGHETGSITKDPDKTEVETYTGKNINRYGMPNAQ